LANGKISLKIKSQNKNMPMGRRFRSRFRFGWAYSVEDEKAILKTKIAMMESKLKMLQELEKEEPDIASVLKAKEAVLKEKIDLFKKELADLESKK
jgi:hypothetical protein